MDERKPHPVSVCCLAAGTEAPEGMFYAHDGALPPPERSGDCRVLLPGQDSARARELLQSGFAGVLLGEAALRDAQAVARLAAEFGGQRVGVLAPARRMHVSWNMDTESNADFRIMRPSVCEPCWEIMLADGRPSGTLAEWWIGEMLKLGAGFALIQADIADDADLNIAAGLVERFGSRLWFAPFAASDPALEDWVRFGQIRNLVLPQRVFDTHPHALAWRGSAADLETETEIG